MDLDGDGRMDIISGSWPGELYLFRRKPNGTFAAAEIVKDEKGSPIKIGSASAVAVADWNGNGKTDLIAGNIKGEVFLIPNEGTSQRPKFGKPEQLRAAGKPIIAEGGDAGPFMADWDGDGKLDLLLGTDAGSVLWFRNTGSREKPELAAAVTLVKPHNRTENPGGEPTRNGMRAKIAVADWNGDGRLDLLVGDYQRINDQSHGFVWVYLRTPDRSVAGN